MQPFTGDLFRELRWWFFPKDNPKHNLGMLGDFDDIELISDVECHFAIRFADGEVEDLASVGDLFDLCAKKAMDTKGPLVEWQSFADILARYATISAGEITRETQFFDRVY